MSSIVLFEGKHEKMLIDELDRRFDIFEKDYLYFHADEESTNSYNVLDESQDDYCRSVIGAPKYSDLLKCENGKTHLDPVISNKLDFFLANFDNVLILRDVDNANHQTFRTEFKSIIEKLIKDFNSNILGERKLTYTEIDERGSFSTTKLEYNSRKAKIIGLYKDLEHLTDITYEDEDEEKKEKIRKFIDEEEVFFQSLASWMKA